jgi:hypothetical protein
MNIERRSFAELDGLLESALSEVEAEPLWQMSSRFLAPSGAAAAGSMYDSRDETPVMRCTDPSRFVIERTGGSNFRGENDQPRARTKSGRVFFTSSMSYRLASAQKEEPQTLSYRNPAVYGGLAESVPTSVRALQGG